MIHTGTSPCSDEPKESSFCSVTYLKAAPSDKKPGCVMDQAQSHKAISTGTRAGDSRPPCERPI